MEQKIHFLYWVSNAISLIIVAIPFTFKVDPTRHADWFNRITVGATAILLLSIAKFLVDDRKAGFETRASFKKDSIANYRIDSVTRATDVLIANKAKEATEHIIKSRDSVVVALAKGYNIVIDSSRNIAYHSKEESDKRIEKLMRDSSLRVSKYLSSTRPSLELDRIIVTKLTKDSVEFQLKLACSGATAFKMNIYAKVGYAEGTVAHQLPVINTEAAVDDQLAADRERTIKIETTALNHLYIFYIKGTYADANDLATLIPFERIVFYDVAKRQLYRPTLQGLNMANRYIKYW